MTINLLLPLLLHTLLLTSLLFSPTAIAADPPTVTTPWGTISGKEVLSPYSGVAYHAYLGIPFALPPVGARRWARPEPHPGPGAAGGVWNASTLGSICPQPPLEVLPGFPAPGEDCLTLNVYTPSAAPSGDGLHSVVVWIYGGGFFLGSAAGYSPSKIVTEGDVIVVVIQYRIGILGFLSSGDSTSPGNYGLWDQRLALQWVQTNIRAFGGDPDTVTLFGESAGAGSIGFHLLSPYSRKLFQRGVQQSGTPLSSWAIQKKPGQFFKKLAQRTGCWQDEGHQQQQSWSESLVSRMTSGSSVASYLRLKEHGKMLACLKTLDADTLLEFTNWLDDGGKLDFFQATPWNPVVDHDFVPRSPLELLNDPEHLLSTGALSKDVMIGVNNNEGGYILDFVSSLPPGDPALDDNGDVSNDVFTAFDTFDALDEDMENQVLTSELKYHYPELAEDPRRLDAIRNVLNFFYLKPLKDGKADVQGIADTFADAYFAVGAVHMSKLMAAARRKHPQRLSNSGGGGGGGGGGGIGSAGSLYLYLFNHFPASKAGLALQGLNHAEDLAYYFDGSPLFPQDKFDADDLKASENYLAMLIDFAKNGHANNALRSQLGAEWPQYSLADESFLSLSAQPRVNKQLYGKRTALWIDLLPSLVSSTRPQRTTGGNWRHTSWNYPPRRNIWYIQLRGTMNKLW